MELFKTIRSPIAAFKNDHYIFTDLHPSLKNVRFRILQTPPEGGSPVPVTEQYTPAFNEQAVFTTKGIFGSLMNDFTNPFDYISEGMVSVDENKMSRRPTIQARQIDGNGNEITGSENRINISDITIFKAAHSGEGDIWSRYETPIHGFANIRNKDNKIIRYFYKDDKIPLTVIYGQLGTPGDRPEFDIYLNDTKIGESGGIAEATRRRDFIVDLSQYDLSGINEFRIVDPDTGENYTNTVNYKFKVDPKCYPRNKSLHFLNKYGGWETYNFIDYSAREQVDKDQYTTYKDIYGKTEMGESVYYGETELNLEGREMVSEFCYYLKEIISSPIVLDEKGTRVKVTSSNLRLDEEGIIEPRLTIKYDREDKIKN